MEKISALLAICARNSPVPDEFPTQRPVTQSFDVFFDLRLNKRLSKQPWTSDLRRYRGHYDVIVMGRSGNRLDHHVVVKTVFYAESLSYK